MKTLDRRWIDLLHEFPEDDTSVRLHSVVTGHVTIGAYCPVAGDWTCFDAHGEVGVLSDLLPDFGEVTHWLPIDQECDGLHDTHA